jgi:hypothetical protein
MPESSRFLGISGLAALSPRVSWRWQQRPSMRVARGSPPSTVGSPRRSLATPTRPPSCAIQRTVRPWSTCGPPENGLPSGASTPGAAPWHAGAFGPGGEHRAWCTSTTTRVSRSRLSKQEPRASMTARTTKFSAPVPKGVNSKRSLLLAVYPRCPVTSLQVSRLMAALRRAAAPSASPASTSSARRARSEGARVLRTCPCLIHGARPLRVAILSSGR